MVLRNHLHQVQAARGRPKPGGQPGQPVEQLHIPFNPLPHPRAQQLHHHLLAARQTGCVNLGDRGGGQGLVLEFREHLLHLAAIEPSQAAARGIGGKRRNIVLQPRQFDGNVFRKQVRTGGDVLAELHEDRPQLFKRLAKTSAPRSALAPTPGQQNQAGGRKGRATPASCNRP